MATLRESRQLSLHELIVTHRDEIIERARAKVGSREAPLATSRELTHGVPLFLTQLGNILREEAGSVPPDGLEMGKSATQHGSDLLHEGFSIAQVVHDYGDVCQAITELALARHLPITTEDFHTLNRCLDNSIASAVSAYSRERSLDASSAELKRQGFFAHELRNRLSAAMLAFQAVKSGRVGVTGSTIAVLERNLQGLRDLINRSIAEVRLTMGQRAREPLRMVRFMEEMEIDASLDAAARGLQFRVERGEDDVLVDVDRHLFTSAIANLLQNAFKFTRPSSHVCLRTVATADHVWIEVEDECGGLPQGATASMFRPFEQLGSDRSGLGVGLAISRQAIEANGGSLSVRDMPGKGCVFIVEIPRAFSREPLPVT